MADDGAPERRGRPWREPAIVVVAGAHREGLAIAGRLLDDLPVLRCPTIVSVRDIDEALLHGRLDGLDARPVFDGASLGDARIWIAPTDRNTLVLDGRLRTEDPGQRVSGDLPSLGKLYHSVRVSFGSRVFAVVADAEQAGGACLRLLEDRGACVVRPLELEPSADTDSWSIPAIVGHLRDVASDTLAEVAS
jgi:chemotaxis response regulator CheB